LAQTLWPCMINISTEVLKKALDTHAIFAVTDSRGVILEVNDKFCEVSGYSRAELIGKTHKVVNSGEHPKEFWTNFWKTIQSGESWKGVICNRKKDGSLYWVDSAVTPVVGPSGKVDRYIAIRSDVSGLMNVEERTRGVEAMSAEIGRVARIGAWEVWMDDMKPVWSNVTRMIHEVDTSFEPDLRTAIEFYKEGESRDRIQSVVQHAMENGGKWDEELQIVTGMEREIWVRAIGEAEMRDGRCVRLFGTFQDIDDRKRAQLEAERVTCLMHDSIEAATEISFIATDVHGTITVFNAGSENMLGYTAQEMVGKQTPALIHDPVEVASRAKELSERFGRPIEGFETFVAVPKVTGSETREWTYDARDGSRFTVSLVVTPVKDQSKRISGYVGIAIDISDKKEKDEALRRREELLEGARERLALATEAGGLGIWDFNLIDGTLEWDKQMFRLYDLDPRNFGGTVEDWKRCVHPDDLAEAELGVQLAIEGKRKFETEFRITLANGRVRYLNGTARVFRDKEGKAVRMIGINGDVTKQAELRERLISLADEAEAASMAKSSFLANMSHEIRTPMNGIIGMTSLMLDSGELPSDQRRNAETVLASSESLLSIINDILDFSKVEAGKMDLEEVEFDIRDTLSDFATLLEHKAQEKKLNFQCSISGELPSALVGDPGRLRQILVNLVGNAIKFTEKGSVTVTVTASRVLATEITLLFSIRDSGIGIPKDKQEALFDSFTQADTSITRKFGGTGLGLAICKKLAELMSGEIGLNSEPGKGSEFWFTAKFKCQNPSSLINADGPVGKACVLVASSDEAHRSSLEGMLNVWGAQVHAAKGGVEVLRELYPGEGKTHRYDAVLLDASMDGMDAYSTARAIKGDNRLEGLNVICFSPLGNPKLYEELEDVSSTVLYRPAGPSKLFDSLARLLSGEKIDSVASRSLFETGQIDQSGRILLVEDNPVNQLVAQGILKKFGLKADLAGNGYEALSALEMIKYDLVLMDVQMPELDGLETTRRIRALANPQWASLPIIAMTAHAREEDRQECLSAGMNDYLSKPVNPKRLGQLLMRWLPDSGEAKVEASAPSPTTTAVKELNGTSVFRREALLENVMGDESLARAVAAAGMQDLKEGGQKLLEALERSDPEGSYPIAHTIKGVAFNLGAERLSALAEGIESKSRQGERIEDAAIVDSLRAELGNFIEAMDCFLQE